MARELSDAGIEHQVAAFADHVRRGGSASRWLESKDFSEADRAAILAAYHDLEEEAS
jgi:hypothetical protein